MNGYLISGVIGAILGVAGYKLGHYYLVGFMRFWWRSH